MKKEIQSILLFLIVQNIILCVLFYLGISSYIGQTIMNIIVGGALYWYLDHEDHIKKHLNGVVLGGVADDRY
jgi:5-bromo-4-chloroindolyl phosphate hydrolysis protein